MNRLVLTAAGSFLLAAVSVLHVACDNFTAGSPKPQGPRLVEIGRTPRGTEGWYKLQFLSEEQGWLAAGSGIWESKDGGKTWARLNMGDAGGQASNDIQSIQFEKSGIGWIERGNSLYQTVDRGRSWREVKIPLRNDAGILQCFHFLKDGKTGWIAGGLARRPKSPDEAKQLTKYDRWETSKGPMILEAAVFRTEDGGINWRNELLPSSSLSRGSIRALYVDEKQHRIALGLNTAFYVQGPLTRWTAVRFDKACIDEKVWRETEDERVPMAVSFVDEKFGWLSFRDGYVAKTMDGGRSWCDLVQPGGVHFEQSEGFFAFLHFTDLEHGFALGSDRLLYYTDDRGKTWRKLAVEAPQGPAKFDYMYYLGQRMGWVVSKDAIYRIYP